MTWTVSSCFVTLAILFLWRVEEIAEACSCSPAHPQQAFCSADVVIRARVVGAQEVEVGNNIYGNPIKQIKYDIKQTKMFKGPNQDIDAIYTASSSAMCGVTLETSGKEYLITGRLEADGKMHITLCHFIEPWDALSDIQRKSLTQRYAMGCDCRITRCTTVPCVISSQAECLWTDWVFEKTVNGEQAKHFACIKRSDDSCAWYRGAAPPKKDFLDIEDP
ncbi:metalloproteinase inhibitor 2b [Toxotes jaculatrix]|uniref:metalloproteinase inhibitor 2b n=1 Tax=Toxotes jaculatrix TaxID=941984 RepID=UPI001B3AE8D0|nr:metalloproteinase inhibitor 2b [Toxotes jaculatrix]